LQHIAEARDKNLILMTTPQHIAEHAALMSMGFEQEQKSSR